jgi:hypothetical protein
MSVKPIIDRYTILNLGSQDGTPDAVVELLYGIPGRLVDFDITKVPFTILCT